jgi:UDP-glucose 4-epimerase
MRVLITGAAGFIGSHLADRLALEGHQTIGVDNLSTGRADNFNGDLRITDIVDRDAFYAVANECAPELVIHCAASYNDPNLWHRDTDTNTAGTINAVLAARHHGARLVYFQTALPPISSYAISKIAGEHYIRLAADVPSLVFRLANIYGPRNVSGPIPTFFKRLTAGDPCTVTETRRDTVYIADLVELVTRAISRARPASSMSAQASPIRSAATTTLSRPFSESPSSRT